MATKKAAKKARKKTSAITRKTKPTVKMWTKEKPTRPGVVRGPGPMWRKAEPTSVALGRRVSAAPRGTVVQGVALTVEERLAELEGKNQALLEQVAVLATKVQALEGKTQFITIVEHDDPSVGIISGMYFSGCRIGFNTRYWMDQPAGQGATVSVGNDFDQFGLFVECENKQPRGLPGPSVAIAARALAKGPAPNIAFQAIVNGSTSENTLFSGQFNDSVILIRPDYQAIELRGSWDRFLIGKVNPLVYRTLFP